MEITEQGIVDQVTIFGRGGGLGDYLMLIREDRSVTLQYASGVFYPELGHVSGWKNQFWLEFKKVGLLQYHFDIIDKLAGSRLRLRTWKKFGKLLFDLIQSEQAQY